MTIIVPQHYTLELSLSGCSAQYIHYVVERSVDMLIEKDSSNAQQYIDYKIQVFWDVWGLSTL
jgi:hypothetical protein